MGGSCVDWCEPVSKFKACFQVDEAAKLEEVGKWMEADDDRWLDI